MSEFAIYVDQITKPSFLPSYGSSTYRASPPGAAEKREQVLACLRRAKRPVSRVWVEDYTGYTKQSVNHILTALVTSGEARRVEGGTVLMWEAA